MDRLHRCCMGRDGRGRRISRQTLSAGRQDCMSKFSDEIRIISPIAWILATLGALTMFACLFLFAIPHHPRFHYWNTTGRALFSVWPAVLIFIWVLIIGYINADARRRGMRYVMWTLLAMF